MLTSLWVALSIACFQSLILQKTMVLLLRDNTTEKDKLCWSYNSNLTKGGDAETP